MGDDVYAFLDEITSLAFYSTQTRALSNVPAQIRPCRLLTRFALFLNCWQGDSDLYLQSRVYLVVVFTRWGAKRVYARKIYDFSYLNIHRYSRTFLNRSRIDKYQIFRSPLLNHDILLLLLPRFTWGNIFPPRKCLGFIQLRESSRSM